jgi:hypothetical protein
VKDTRDQNQEEPDPARGKAPREKLPGQHIARAGEQLWKQSNTQTPLLPSQRQVPERLQGGMYHQTLEWGQC